jgi:dUTPase
MSGLFLITVSADAADRSLLPSYDSLFDSAAYLMSAEDVVVPAGKRVAVSTGVRMSMPNTELCGLLSPVMNLSIDGLLMMDSGRVIDQWDVSEIKTLLWNTTDDDITLAKGQRVCRYSVIPVAHASYVSVPADVLDTIHHSDECGAAMDWSSLEH